MRILISTILLVLSIDGFARIMTPEERFCSDLEVNYRATQSDANGQCQTIKSCQDKRRACNQRTDNQTSCENLNHCMINQYPEGSRPESMCNYEWKFSFIVGKNVCQVSKVKGFPTHGKDCFGYFGWEDERRYSDPKFNCEGQKVRYHDYREAYVKAYYNFRQAIDSGKCRVLNDHTIKLEDKCKAIYESVD